MRVCARVERDRNKNDEKNIKWNRKSYANKS